MAKLQTLTVQVLKKSSILIYGLMMNIFSLFMKD